MAEEKNIVELTADIAEAIVSGDEDKISKAKQAEQKFWEGHDGGGPGDEGPSKKEDNYRPPPPDNEKDKDRDGKNNDQNNDKDKSSENEDNENEQDNDDDGKEQGDEGNEGSDLTNAIDTLAEINLDDVSQGAEWGQDFQSEMDKCEQGENPEKEQEQEGGEEQEIEM